MCPSDTQRNRGRTSGPLAALVALILGQSLVTLLAGVNLRVEMLASPLANWEYVRPRELIALLLITPGSVALLFGIIFTLERKRDDAARPMTLFMASACLLGISMGVHEPMNAITAGAAGAGLGRAAESMRFWDDIFSHAVFFLSYAGISLALVWSQARNPLPRPMGKGVRIVLLACGALAGAGIYHTLVEGGNILMDLGVIAAVILAAEVLRRGKPFAVLPVSVTLESAYVLALAALVVQRIW